MTLGKASRVPVILNINHIEIRESQKLVLLGLTIDNRLTFKDHIDILCRNASYKLHAFRIIRIYLIPEKEEILQMILSIPSLTMSLLLCLYYMDVLQRDKLFKDQTKSVNVFEYQ